jgi:hypothetical protein
MSGVNVDGFHYWGRDYGLALYEAVGPNAGDFNSDGLEDMTDINLLWAKRATAVPPTEAKYDLVADGIINLADAQDLVQDIIGTAMADTNLDHKVDIVDPGNLANKYDQAGGFADGDTDFNGLINILDLGNLADDYGKDYPVGSAAPEPATLLLLIMGAAALIRRRS